MFKYIYTDSCSDWVEAGPQVSSNFGKEMCSALKGAMGANVLGLDIAPVTSARASLRAAPRWHPSWCRAPIYRAVQRSREQPSRFQHGPICMVAAIDAPEAQKDKQDEQQQAPSAKHLRREEAILFQGDIALYLLLCLSSGPTCR